MTRDKDTTEFLVMLPVFVIAHIGADGGVRGLTTVETRDKIAIALFTDDDLANRFVNEIVDSSDHEHLKIAEFHEVHELLRFLQEARSHWKATHVAFDPVKPGQKPAAVTIEEAIAGFKGSDNL